MEGLSETLPRVALSTSLGTIILGIDAAAAPITAQNFLEYVRRGVFDQTTFYRVAAPCNQVAETTRIDVIQGGLNEDLQPPFPPIAHEPTYRTGLTHCDGALSMARRSVGSAAGAFFICIGDQPELNHGGRRHPDGQGFAAFGQVLEGMEVVRAIWERAETGLFLSCPVPIISAVVLETEWGSSDPEAEFAPAVLRHGGANALATAMTTPSPKSPGREASKAHKHPDETHWERVIDRATD